MIYHYCSLETFFHMISGYSSNLKEPNLRLHHTDSMDDSFDNKLLDNALNQILTETGLKNEYISATSDIYIACFGNTNSNEHLWCKYADGNKGVCIGFKFPYHLNGSKFKSQDSEFIYTQEIEYYSEESLNQFANSFRERFIRLKDGKEERIKDDEIIVRFFPDWFYELFVKNHFSKKMKYKPEEEIRLIYRTNRRRFDVHIPNERKPKELSEVQYGIKKVAEKQVLSPYFELRIKEFISEITLGRNCTSNRVDVSAFLEHFLGRTIAVKS